MLKRSLMSMSVALLAVVFAGGRETVCAKETAADDLLWVATGSQPDVNFNGRWVVFEASLPETVALGVRDMRLKKTSVVTRTPPRRYPTIGDTIFATAWEESTEERDPLCGFSNYTLIRADNGTYVDSVQSRLFDGLPAGLVADASCHAPAISGDGSHVAFESRAGNLGTGATVLPGCDTIQVYVHDRIQARTSIVSVGNDHVAGNRHSVRPSVSRSGRYVAFESFADDLAANDRNGIPDVFVRDTFAGVTTLVSHADGSTAPIGGVDPVISANGRYVAYSGKTTPDLFGGTGAGVYTVVYVRDLQNGTQVIASRKDGLGGDPVVADSTSMSFDGRYVSFVTFDSTVVPGGLTFQTRQCIVRDLTTGENRLATRAQGPLGAPLDKSGGEPGIIGTPRLSGDGRYLTFVTNADTISKRGKKGEPDIYMRDVWGPTGVTPDFRPPVVKKLSGPASIPQATDCTGTPATLGTLTVRASEAATLTVRFVLAANNRLEEQGSFTQDVAAGDTQIPLTGCVGTDILPKGNYYVYATLIDSGLNVSKSKYRALKIL